MTSGSTRSRTSRSTGTADNKHPMKPIVVFTRPKGNQICSWAHYVVNILVLKALIIKSILDIGGQHIFIECEN